MTEGDILDISQDQFQQDCSYQGKALNVPTAFKGLWSSNSFEKLNVKKKKIKWKKFVKKFEFFL